MYTIGPKWWDEGGCGLYQKSQSHSRSTYNVAVDVVEADDVADDAVPAQRDLAERAKVEPLEPRHVTDALHQVLEACGRETTTTTFTWTLD